jgi:hypothetical protein
LPKTIGKGGTLPNTSSTQDLVSLTLRKIRKVVQSIIANLGPVTEDQIPYLKAAYAKKKPRLVYDETPEN